MPGTLSLTPHEHAQVTIALALEQQGFTEAAAWLRAQIKPLQLVDWDPVDDSLVSPAAMAEWATVFRAHRGSPAPFPPDQPTP